MYLMQGYDDALRDILRRGVVKTNRRTGQKTLALCGVQTRYRLDQGCFPLVTRRKIWPKSIFAELLWFISGSTNNNDLKALGANIWTPWVSKKFEEQHGFVPGALGPVYGFQLRYFNGEYGDGSHGEQYGVGGYDQLANMINLLKIDPGDRRILFSLWNPQQLHLMKLPPCHYTYQVFVDDNGDLTGHLTQRSNDYMVGVCANVQFYSALTIMLAQQVNLNAVEFVHEAVDAHIYEPQIQAVEEYLSLPILPSPKLTINKAKDIYSYSIDDFVLECFVSGPKIQVPVEV